ncbi:MAG: hypothetical protein FWH04_05220 [Oscillospiraceae bacterium]|nr:hypothetical protein [Oscillospiraceae bacterium]
MKQRWLSLSLAVVMVFSLAFAGLSVAVAADTEVENNHNIDYASSIPSLVTATPVKDSTQSGDANTYDEGSAVIDLAAETVSTPSGFTVAAFSLDAGAKWQNGASFNLGKLLAKDLTLMLSDKEVDKKTAKPIAGKAESGSDPAVDGATIIAFPKINGRPKAAKLAINYAIYDDSTSITTGQWILSEKKATVAADVSGLQIAVAAADKKNPDGNGYGRFKDGQGINVMPTEEGQKPVKTIYLIRVAPVGGNDGSAQAAGASYKVTASGQLAQPKLKADYKKEIIKPKAGMSVKINDTITLYQKGMPELKGVPIGDILGSDETLMSVWTVATAKKPVSRVQEITLAPRAALSDSPESLMLNGVFKLDKKYEIFNSAGNKWGGLPKLTAGQENIAIARLKATAKASKTGTSYTGVAASANGSIALQWGKDSGGKDVVLNAWFCPPGVEPPATTVIVNISQQPQNVTLQVGASGTLAVTATSTGELSYEWYSCDNAQKENPVKIDDAASRIFEIPTDLAMGNYFFFAKVTGTEDGKDQVTVESSAARVSLGYSPDITPLTDRIVTFGQTGSLGVTAAPTGGGDLLYRWYSCSDASKANPQMITDAQNASASTATLVIPNTTAAGDYYYFVRVTNRIGTIDLSLESNAAKVTVGYGPTIPPIANKSVTFGTADSISVAATPAGGGTLSYRWYSCTDTNKSNPEIITDAMNSSAGTATLAIPATTPAGTYYYFVRVTNSIGTLHITSESNAVLVTVSAS